MNPEQRIKHLILMRAVADDVVTLAEPITAENVDAVYRASNDDWQLQDYMTYLRCGEVETGLKTPISRNYESKAVAAKMLDGGWVGWTYWYGGGKHSEPEAIDWMDEAYELDCKEEQRLIVVREFTRKDAS